MMRIYFLTLTIFCLSIRFAQCSPEDEFVDPLDMLNYDRSTMSMKKPSTKLDTEPIHNDQCTAFVSRFINIMLKNTGIQSNDINNEVLKSYASVTISVQDLQLLKHMSSKKNFDYLEIDRILNVMFTPENENICKSQSTYNYLKSYQIKDVLHWSVVCIISIVLLYIIFQHIHHLSSITFVLFVIFILAFASTWYTMYTKAEIKRSVYLEHMPHNCQKNKNNWLTFSWFKNDIDECKKYKEAIYLDPKYSIAITEVLAEMISKIMMKPIETLGDSIYVFNKSVLKDFPFWGQLILIPIIIIIIIKALLLSCALLLGRQLNMKSVFGYGGTSIGPESTSNRGFNKNTITKDNTSHPIASVQHPQLPKMNLNFNFFHPNSSNNKVILPDDYNLVFNRKCNKINQNIEHDLASMLKDKDNDSVDSKISEELIKIKPRHRTLSI